MRIIRARHLAKLHFKQRSVGYDTRGIDCTTGRGAAALRAVYARGSHPTLQTNVVLRLTQDRETRSIVFHLNIGKGDYLVRSSKLYVGTDGKRLPGLVNLRKAETDIFLAYTKKAQERFF